MNDFKDLLGKSIQSIHAFCTVTTNELGQEIRYATMIVFRTRKGKLVAYKPLPDLSRWSEFSHQFLSPEWENSEYILGSEVVTVETHLLGRYPIGDFVRDFYGLLVRTANGHQAIFEYLVEHQGYHEGWLVKANPQQGVMVELAGVAGDQTLWERLSEEDSG